MTKGQIRQSLSGYYDVVTTDGIEYRTRARGNFRKKKQTPLVGDWVEFKAQKADEGYILEIYPRKKPVGQTTNGQFGHGYCSHSLYSARFFQ